MFTIAATAGAQVRIIDMTGRTVMVRTMISEYMDIDLSAQPKGIYAVTMLNGADASRRKVVRQ
jgi:hypothetical protein